MKMSDIEEKVIELLGDVIQEEDIDMDDSLMTNQDCQDCP